MSNPWKPIVDKVPNKTTSPNQIILSTPFFIIIIDKKNSIHNSRKKSKNKVDECIISWDIKLKETNLQQVNIKSTDEDPSLNSFNQKDKKEKWSPKSSRSTHLTTYIQERETTEEDSRTSNEIYIKTRKLRQKGLKEQSRTAIIQREEKMPYSKIQRYSLTSIKQQIFNVNQLK